MTVQKLLSAYIIEKKELMMNPIHIKYLLYYATTTILSARQIARKFGLEIDIGLMEIQVLYGGGTDNGI